MAEERIVAQNTQISRVGNLEVSEKNTIYQQNDFDYQAEAQQTCSDQFHGELVSRNALTGLIGKAIQALADLDIIKKTLFYGKKNKHFAPSLGDGLDCSNINDLNGLTIEQGVNVIHSIFGKATESGELLEALLNCIENDTPFDVTNFKEEIGDGMWYDAIGLNAIGATIEEVQHTNIAKLRARYPDKFTEYGAQNRNLTAERKILEA